VLLTGQAAGVLAAKSIKDKKRIRDIPVREVQEELLKLKCYLMPFVDVKPDDPHWEAIQRVGVTGILKGVGKPEGWANKMFFYPDSLIKASVFYDGLCEYFPNRPLNQNILQSEYVNFSAFSMLLAKFYNVNYQNGLTKFIPPLIKKDALLEEKIKGDPIWQPITEKMYNDEPFTRKEISALLHRYLEPFGRKVSMKGFFSGKLYAWYK
jgi:hypothetical protein